MSQPSEPISIAMIPLGPKPKISPSAITRDLSSTWPDLPALGPDEKSDKTILTFDVGEHAHVFLALMPAPVLAKTNKVVYAPSKFGHEGQGMRLDYKPLKKKGWFGR